MCRSMKWNKNLDKSPHNHRYLTFDKEHKYTLERRQPVKQMVLENLDSTVWTNKQDAYILPLEKSSLNDLNVGSNTVKLEEQK